MKIFYVSTDPPQYQPLKGKGTPWSGKYPRDGVLLIASSRINIQSCKYSSIARMNVEWFDLIYFLVRADLKKNNLLMSNT